MYSWWWRPGGCGAHSLGTALYLKPDVSGQNLRTRQELNTQDRVRGTGRKKTTDTGKEKRGKKTFEEKVRCYERRQSIKLPLRQQKVRTLTELQRNHYRDYRIFEEKPNPSFFSYLISSHYTLRRCFLLDYKTRDPTKILHLLRSEWLEHKKKGQTGREMYQAVLPNDLLHLQTFQCCTKQSTMPGSLPEKCPRALQCPHLLLFQNIVNTNIVQEIKTPEQGGIW